MQKTAHWKSVVIWSIISAAFIGPGTVTTAMAAGSAFQLDLLWAVVVATVACIMLQEIAARIAIASNLNIGQSMILKFGARRGKLLQWVIGGSVVMGCAAYEAGNIMGAVAGLRMLFGTDAKWLTAGVALVAAVFLWRGRPRWISNLMMILVALMTIAFLQVAFTRDFTTHQILKAALVPKVPPGGALLLLGLVGTTIVPYNLFLAPGISKGQNIAMMRFGLTVAILLGGLITGAILVAGTAVKEFTNFSVLFAGVQMNAGATAALALALGLFAAGFSSSITAAYAAGEISSTVLGVTGNNVSLCVRMTVLITGFVVGILGLQPVEVILVVQALNGLILPVVAIFLILMVNDPALVPAKFRHRPLYNVALLTVLSGILLISAHNIVKTFGAGFALNSPGLQFLLFSITALVVLWVTVRVVRMRRGTHE